MAATPQRLAKQGFCIHYTIFCYNVKKNRLTNFVLKFSFSTFYIGLFSGLLPLLGYFGAVLVILSTNIIECDKS